MTQNRKDRFYEGWLYHRLIDPTLVRVRRVVHDQINPGSTLIDIGCGTGELIFSLADRCSELVGVEASRRMWNYASRRARTLGLTNVRFVFGDAAKLEKFQARFFDYATASMVIHEMDASHRLPILGEMQRVAETLILVDYQVPPPANLEARLCRLIERLAGRDHYRNFSSFVNSG